MILIINRFLIKGHVNFSPNKCYHQNLLYIYIYIYIYIYFFYFFNAYGWPVRLEINFLAQKVLMGVRVNGLFMSC